jgi:ubiquinone/menaquinone biosynthesis C-methylase UbiE
MTGVDGYGPATYGDAFADVYDDWYAGVSDVAATVSRIVELAGASGTGARVLELGVGTGRLALPMAAAGLHVHGVDASEAMLDRLRAKDPEGRVAITLGDMARDLPDGPFDVALCAYNTLFNLTSPGDQAACFVAVARCLGDGGCFVVEAFVPDPTLAGSSVSVRSLAVDRVVLSVSLHDPAASTAAGQFVEISETAGVRLRPWSIRYATPAELDAMAERAGFWLEHRWTSFAEPAFDDDADRHVSVYRLGNRWTKR